MAPNKSTAHSPTSPEDLCGHHLRPPDSADAEDKRSAELDRAILPGGDSAEVLGYRQDVCLINPSLQRGRVTAQWISTEHCRLGVKLPVAAEVVQREAGKQIERGAAGERALDLDVALRGGESRPG